MGVNFSSPRSDQPEDPIEIARLVMTAMQEGQLTFSDNIAFRVLLFHGYVPQNLSSNIIIEADKSRKYDLFTEHNIDLIDLDCCDKLRIKTDSLIDKIGHDYFIDLARTFNTTKLPQASIAL